MCEVCAAVGFDIHADGFQVNSTTTGNQFGPGIVRLPDGRFIVAYLSSDTPGNGIDVRARIFERDGTATGNDFVVTQTTAGDQTAAGVLLNSNGTLSFLWQTPDPMLAGNTQLMVRVFDLAGNPLGTERQVSTSGADGSYSLFQRPNGTFFVIYENDADIYGRTFDQNWTPWISEVQLNTTTAGDQLRASLFPLTNGNILVAFQSDDNADGGGGTGNLIRNRVFSPNNEIWTLVSINGSTDDFVVNTTGTGGQTNVRLGRLFDGRMLEVWQSDDTGDGSGTTIRARIIAATGDPTGAAADFIVDTTGTGNQSRPAILGFNDGRLLIYWHSFESATDTIRGRFVHANGSFDASDFVITNLPDTSGPTFSLALLANQQVEFNYQGTGSGDGSGTGILGAIGTPANLPLNTSFSNPGTSPYDATLPSFGWDQAAAQISRDNAPWNDVLGSPHSLTYSYRATSAGVSYSNGASGFTPFNAAEIAAAEAAIQLWEDVANITLTRVQDPGSQYSDAGQFLLWNYATATAGSVAEAAAGFGGASFSAGAWHHVVYLNDDRPSVTAPGVNNGGFQVFLHEIGHALGLSHPGNYAILPGGGSPAYDGSAVYREDSQQFTVMSYFDESVTHANFVDTFPATPLLDDIAALQRLYGANTATRTGDTTYGFNSNTGRSSYTIGSASQHAVFAVWDGGGNDTLDFSGYGARQIITLVPEQFSSVGGLEFNVAIARGTVIENAIGGTGADLIIGNSANNTLSGGSGNDKLDGAAGHDSLAGGPGADIFVLGAAALPDAQAVTHVFDRLIDYDQGNSGGYSAGEGDQIDLSAPLSSAYNHGAGAPVSALVRVVASGADANLQVDADGATNGAHWTTLAHLNGIHAGNNINIILDSSLPAGTAVTAVAQDLPTSPAFMLDAFGAANIGGGWSSADQFPRALADVNGDGMADIVGFGYAGATVALATGGGHFAAPFFSLDAFGAANFGGGWASQDQFPRKLADVNGDGMADIVGFGYAGATVALATGGGHFAAPFFSLDAFGAANFGGGWASQDQFPRELADVNGDGMADIVGFGYAGATVALATGGGHFAAPFFSLDAFGAANFGGGWASQDQFPRQLADVNGDGMADIVRFGYAGATVALATGGGHFAAPFFTLDAFGAANFGGGWSSQDQYLRSLADLNGDGVADIVGFGIAGMTEALATGGGHFAPPAFTLSAFGSANSAGGWSSDNQFPRKLADVNGDGMADLAGFGLAGVTISPAHGFLFV